MERPAANEMKSVPAMPVEQKSTIASPVEPPAAVEAKPPQAGPDHGTTAAAPVERPAGTETKPVQAAPVEQKSTTATSVEVKPVKANKSVKLAHRTQKHHQLTLERHIHREFRNIERTIGFALPIPLVIRFYW